MGLAGFLVKLSGTIKLARTRKEMDVPLLRPCLHVTGAVHQTSLVKTTRGAA